MLFTTTTQFVVLALCLVAGWFFGLASHPGGRKWRTRYEEEREAHAAYRREVEAQRKTDADRLAELERRNAALENDLRTARTAVPAAPIAADAPRRGAWLGSGRDDDLPRAGVDGHDAAGPYRGRLCGREGAGGVGCQAGAPHDAGSDHSHAWFERADGSIDAMDQQRRLRVVDQRQVGEDNRLLLRP